MHEEFNKNCQGSLFWQGSVLELMQEQSRSLAAEADAYDRNVVLNSNLEQIGDFLAQKYTLEPVTLHRGATEVVEHGQTTIDRQNPMCLVVYDPCVSKNSAATFYRFVIPFEGDSRLFMRRPSEYEIELPWGTVGESQLCILCKTTSRDSGVIRARIDDNLNRIERWLHRANREVQPFNVRLKEMALGRLQARKNKLLQNDSLAASLGFPLRPRTGEGAMSIASVTRKQLPIKTQSTALVPSKPEPLLEMEHYEHILDVISNMVLVMERSPESFKRLDEEALRTHILVQLNGHYEGQATGETFNAQGKTDVLIRVEGKNIFIAECKFWRGAESFKKTIDQLLSYAAWRDTKTAIIVFNRNKDTSAVVAQLPALVKMHPNFRHEDSDYKKDTNSRFVLHHRDDKSRSLMLTVLVFDVPY